MNELMHGHKKLIKIVKIKDDGFVEFLFAVDSATTNVEMLLPYKNFIEFCERNRVSFVSEEEEKEIEKDDILWKYGTEEFLN